MANDTWNSSVVKQNLNPTWTPEDCHDFLAWALRIEGRCGDVALEEVVVFVESRKEKLGNRLSEH